MPWGHKAGGAWGQGEQWGHLEEQACGSQEKHNLNYVPRASAKSPVRLSHHLRSRGESQKKDEDEERDDRRRARRKGAEQAEKGKERQPWIHLRSHPRDHGAEPRKEERESRGRGTSGRERRPRRASLGSGTSQGMRAAV